MLEISQRVENARPMLAAVGRRTHAVEQHLERQLIAANVIKMLGDEYPLERILAPLQLREHIGEPLRMFVKKCQLGAIRVRGFGCRRTGIWHQHGSALKGAVGDLGRAEYYGPDTSDHGAAALFEWRARHADLCLYSSVIARPPLLPNQALGSWHEPQRRQLRSRQMQAQGRSHRGSYLPHVDLSQRTSFCDARTDDQKSRAHLGPLRQVA